MVEWLGRGGIAHTAESWVREAERAGAEVTLVTRAGRELAGAVDRVVAVPDRHGAPAALVAAVRATSRLLRELRPATLVLHGSVVPQAEIAVLRAARRAGTTSVLVAHEPRIARAFPRAQHGLARLVRAADVVVVHSHFVGGELTASTSRSDLTLLPLPLPLGLVQPDGRPSVRGGSVVEPGAGLLALHFGHLHRGYKGTAAVLELASQGVPGWRFALVGKGAPQEAGAAVTVPRFLDAADLVATIGAADAAVLPYERASQSAAVVLAAALGPVVVASAVGAIPEQVDDGRTGLLLPAGAAAPRWREALETLRDEALRLRLQAAARAAVVAAHREFAAGVGRLVG